MKEGNLSKPFVAVESDKGFFFYFSTGLAFSLITDKIQSLKTKEDSTLKKGEIIIPPRYVEVDGSVIFLAGPIRGAIDWQGKAIHYIRNKNPELHIASPRRPILTQDEFQEATFDEQVDWEHYYLQQAAENGVTLFWLAKEAEHRCDRAYAQTTRFELGEATGVHRFASIKVVVGIEDGFTGRKYIRKTLVKKYPNIPICDTLEQTCDLAIQLAKERKN